MTLALALLTLSALSEPVFRPMPPTEPAPRQCRTVRVTGYVRSEYGPLTFDGTPVMTAEPIAAASWDIPMGTLLDLDGVGVVRVADRGMLGSSGWVDVAVDTRSEAYALTGWREACVVEDR